MFDQILRSIHLIYPSTPDSPPPTISTSFSFPNNIKFSAELTVSFSALIRIINDVTFPSLISLSKDQKIWYKPR